MAVLTEISKHDLITYLAQFEVGELESYDGIKAGIENTNYFVNTNRGSFVLTLIEQWPYDQCQYFLDLVDHLSNKGIPCARPVRDKQGAMLRLMRDKPVSLVQRLAGKGTQTPDKIRCAIVGDLLARMHLAGVDFNVPRVDRRGMSWRRKVTARILPKLPAVIGELLQNELSYHQQHENLILPKGPIHADLFTDNVLFVNNSNYSVIDFYYACDGYHVYDLCITLNQWCSEIDGSLNFEKFQSLIQAYHSQREISLLEQRFMVRMMRYAAMRFLLSRYQDKLFPKDAHLTGIHDPDEMLHKLQNRIQYGEEIDAVIEQTLS